MLTISTGYYPQALLLVLARVAGVLWVLQRLGASKIPVTFRAAIALVIAVGLLPMVPQTWMEDARMLDSMSMLLLAVLQELAIGACMGFACELIIAATGVAGTLIGMGSSLMMAQSIDPSSGESSGLPRQILMNCFVLFLLLTDTHLVMIHLLAGSFSSLPMLSTWDLQSLSGMITGLGSLMFEWGLRLAMPVVCMALVLDACLGLIAKLAPSFQVLFLSMPIRLFAGLSVLGLIIRTGITSFDVMREKMLLVFERLLTA